MKDVSGVSGGEGQGEEEEDGQWDSQEGVNNAWRCTVHTHTFDGSARRDASPPFVWSPGRQHHLARSSLPRKRVSLRRAQLFDTAAKQWSVSRGQVSTLPLSKTHLRLPNSDSRRVHQSRRSFREQLQLLKHQLIHSCSGSPPPNKASAPLRLHETFITVRTTDGPDTFHTCFHPHYLQQTCYVSLTPPDGCSC